MTSESLLALTIGLAPWAVFAFFVWRSNRREADIAARLREFRTRQGKADLRRRVAAEILRDLPKK